jgi:hypothetical protein
VKSRNKSKRKRAGPDIRSHKPQAREKLWRPSDPNGHPCVLPYDFGLQDAAALATLEVRKDEWIGVFHEGAYPPYGELICSSQSPRDLYRKLKQQGVSRVSVRLARTKEELSVVPSPERRPLDWHEELKRAGRMTDDIAFLNFGYAAGPVKQLAQTTDANDEENRINSLWRMYPAAAEKLGLPKPPASRLNHRGADSLAGTPTDGGLRQANAERPVHANTEREIPKPVQRRTRRRLDRREKRILEVLKKGNVHSHVYCSALEIEKIPPRAGWIDEGCPITYPEAIKVPKWRQRIFDEKYRISQFLPKKITPTRRKRVILVANE